MANKTQDSTVLEMIISVHSSMVIVYGFIALIYFELVIWHDTIRVQLKRYREPDYTYIDNIHKLSTNIKDICTGHRNRKNSEPLARFSGLFRRVQNIVHVGACTYIVFILQCQNVQTISKLSNQCRNKQQTITAFIWGEHQVVNHWEVVFSSGLQLWMLPRNSWHFGEISFKKHY